MNVVSLCSNIPHGEGLAALRMFIETKYDKKISNDWKICWTRNCDSKTVPFYGNVKPFVKFSTLEKQKPNFRTGSMTKKVNIERLEKKTRIINYLSSYDR